MTTLDARARRAAHAIHAGVAEFTPAATFDTVFARHRRWRTIQAGLAGAAAAAAIVAGGLIIAPHPDPEVANVDVTIVEPTVPNPDDNALPPDESPITPYLTPPDETTVPETTVAPVTTTVPETTLPDTTPPLLEITTPQPNQHFEVAAIEFAGVTEPGATVAAGQYQADVDAAGNWSIVLILSPGANGARLVATDAAGNETEARVTVYYDQPVTEETTTTTTTDAPPPAIEFTAYAVYQECAESPPFDVYWGTAPAGTTITVTSEYGSGSTTANDNGDWELRVYFPESPVGKVFEAKVTDDNGHKKVFDFVHVG